MEIEVFPSAEALKVTYCGGGVLLTQWCVVAGKEVTIFVPSAYIGALSKAMKAASESGEG